MRIYYHIFYSMSTIFHKLFSYLIKKLKSLLNFRIILFEFFKAFSFIIALKKIVIPAIKAEIDIEIKIIIFKLSILLVKLTTIQAPLAPHRVLQISPTTSAQKEHTFSEFLQSLIPIFAPLTLSFAHFSNTLIFADVAAIPNISNITEMNIKKVIPKDATIIPILVRSVWLIKPKNSDKLIAIKNILNAHKYLYFLLYLVIMIL